VQPDDFVGRRMGSQVGLAALSRAQAFYEGSAVP
jgi:hypothetical protein